MRAEGTCNKAEKSEEKEQSEEYDANPTSPRPFHIVLPP
jgi:hypothetical protein